MKFILSAIMMVSTIMLASHSQAQEYPEKTIRIIVPYSPGGSTDLIARTIGERLSERWGQQVIIDNRPGGAGVIGVNAVITAPADGYTLLVGTSGELTVSPILYDAATYNAAEDLEPITIIARNPFVIAGYAESDIKSIEDLLKQAKEKPGSISYASAGNGSGNHLAGAWFASAAGLDLVHVPYRGAGPAAVAVASGEVPIGFLSPASVMPHIDAGNIVPLGITSKNRPPFAKDWDTADESGVPGFDVDAWIGMLAPAGTSDEIVQKLNAAVREILEDEELIQSLADRGLVASGMDTDTFRESIEKNQSEFARVIEEAEITVDQ